MSDMLESYDYVIVGAGAAGCLLANRLSADASVRVLLLDAGGKDDYFWIPIPAGYLYCLENPRVDWGFKTAPIPGLEQRSLAYPRGKVFGGCTSINGMIYMRGQMQDYDGWQQQYGCPGWSWNEVLHYFLKHEDQRTLQPDDFGDTHSSGGEWRVEKPRMTWEILDAWARATEQYGIPNVNDFNRGTNEGSSYFQLNQKAGRRWNAVRGFLKPVLDRPNLSVLTHAKAQHIILKDRRAIGVQIMRNGIPMRLGAKRELILAAGAIGSPHLLQLSGIGPGEILRGHGIEVAVDQPEVGANLQDHLEIRCVFKVSGVKTLNENAQTMTQKAKIALDYILQQDGPMSMGHSVLGTFAKSSPTYETANLQYHIQPFSLDAYGEPFHKFPAFTAGVSNVRPTSRGHVHITSPNSDTHPEIQPNYLSTDADCYVAADAIRLTRSIVSQPALQYFSPEELRPGKEIDNDDTEALVAMAGTISNSIFHPVGTCRMGSDETAVVTPRLEVNGVNGLRVVDASIMPTITSGNVNAPTLMIAEKGAEMILEDWK